MYKMRVKELRLKGELANRSGFVTENMTSATPDNAVGTTFKNVAVNENGEFVVQSASPSVPEVYRGTTAPASPVAGWLWVDTSQGVGGQVIKQWNGTIWTELDRLSVPNTPITVDTTITDAGTLFIIDGNSGLPINVTLPAASTMKGRKIEFYKYRGTSQISLVVPTATLINTYALSSTTYAFKNINPNYFMTVRSDGGNWIVDDDNIYNRVANTLYVDFTYGNNTYAVREFESRPFATVAAAYAASQDGDRIVLRPGVYNTGNFTISHKVYFECEEGVVITNGRLAYTDGVEVFRNGGYQNRPAGSFPMFRLLGNHVINVHIRDWFSAQAVYVFDTAGGIVNANISGVINVDKNVEMLGTSVGNVIFAKQQPVSGCNLSINVGGNIINCCPIYTSIVSASTNCNFHTNANEIIADATTGITEIAGFSSNSSNTLYTVKANKITYLHPGRFAFSSPTDSFNNKLVIDCPYIDTDRYVHIQGAGNVATINGVYHTYIQFGPYTSGQQAAVSGVIATNVVNLHVDEIEGIYNTSKTVVPGYGLLYAGGVVGGGIINNYTKKWSSLKNEVFGIDSTTLIIHIHPSIINTFGGILHKKGRDAGLGYDGIIRRDKLGATTGIDYQFNFYNGSVIINDGDSFFAAGAGGPNNTIVSYYDNTIFDGLENINVDLVRYMYNGITEINTPGTYTILDSDKDIYADLSLGSYNLVLPLASKNQWREISAKATALNPTNTITFQGAVGNEIDGATTFTFGAITNLPNYTIKSALNKWRVK